MSINSLPHLAGIYLITCLANGRTYIGSSQNIHKRLTAHRGELRRKVHRNVHLQRAFDKYGEANFVVTVLELCVKSRLLEREAYWFKIYKVGNPDVSFNINPIPYSSAGHKASDESKQKMSIAQKRLTAENRSKRFKFPKGNKLQLGRKLTPEHRRKLSEANKRPKSEAMKDKLSSIYGKQYEVTDPNGNVYVIKGLSRFCKANNLTWSAMAAVANGKRKQHKGWLCRHID